MHGMTERYCFCSTGHYTGLLIICGKKNQNFVGFSGANSRKKSADFAGKKSKFAEKSADFMGDFGGKLRQETISKKQPISLDFVLANFAKIDSIFASI